MATDSYCCSNNDDFEAYVELKNLSDNISKLASIDSYTPRTELQAEKA